MDDVATADRPAPTPARVHGRRREVLPSAGSSYTLSPAILVMLGTGLSVLGGFTIAGLTLVLLNNDFSDIDKSGSTTAPKVGRRMRRKRGRKNRSIEPQRCKPETSL